MATTKVFFNIYFVEVKKSLCIHFKVFLYKIILAGDKWRVLPNIEKAYVGGGGGIVGRENVGGRGANVVYSFMFYVMVLLDIHVCATWFEHIV